MSVKTYYNDSGIHTQDKSPVSFYLNGGKDQANVIISGTIVGCAFYDKIFGPTATSTTDNITFPLPVGQAGAAGNTNPSTACQSFYGSDGGLGIACFQNTTQPASIRLQSNYTRSSGHARFSTENRLWRAKNIVLNKNACIRIPYIDFAITTSAAASIDLTSQTILSVAGRNYAKNAVAFRFRRTISRTSGQDTVTIPNGTQAGVGTIIIICNVSSHNLQIFVFGGGASFDDPRSTQTGTLQNITIPPVTEIILMYRSSTEISVLHSLP